MAAMTLADFLSRERGRQAALAKAIGAHAPDVSRWAKGERVVPAEYCPAIERASLRLVTCEELRPDVDWEVIRNPNALDVADAAVAAA